MTPNEARRYIEIYRNWQEKDAELDNDDVSRQALERMEKRELEARQILDAETMRLMREIVLAQAMELTK